MAMNGELRDYIYLDWERVRSLAPQVTAAPGPEAGGASSPGSEGSRTHQQETYAQLEQALTETGKVTCLDATYDYPAQWTESGLRDGQFIMTSGVFRVIDYENTSHFLAAAPDLMKSAFHMANWLAAKGNLTFNQKKALEEQKTDQQRQIADLKALKLDQFAGFVKQVFGAGVRFRVVPSAEYPTVLLVGSAHREFFLEAPAGLAEKYGYIIDAGWQMLGQLNVPQAHHDTVPMPTGNNILDNFEAMTMHVNGIFRVAHAPVFPAVSVTPICIYRNC